MPQPAYFKACFKAITVPKSFEDSKRWRQLLGSVLPDLILKYADCSRRGKFDAVIYNADVIVGYSSSFSSPSPGSLIAVLRRSA